MSALLDYAASVKAQETVWELVSLCNLDTILQVITFLIHKSKRHLKEVTMRNICSSVIPIVENGRKRVSNVGWQLYSGFDPFKACTYLFYHYDVLREKQVLRHVHRYIFTLAHSFPYAEYKS